MNESHKVVSGWWQFYNGMGWVCLNTSLISGWYIALFCDHTHQQWWIIPHKNRKRQRNSHKKNLFHIGNHFKTTKYSKSQEQVQCSNVLKRASIKNRQDLLQYFDWLKIIFVLFWRFWYRFLQKEKWKDIQNSLSQICIANQRKNIYFI